MGMELGFAMALSTPWNGPATVPPAGTYVSAVEAGGWSGVATDPSSAVAQQLSVSRNGFNALSQPVTPVDTITVTARLREAYPNQATLTADKVVLSDFIYAGDGVPGATNLSLRPAPKPIAAWLTRDLEICKANTFTARLAVAHAHARAGRPVAAVRFRASDGTTTVEALVSTMSMASYSASGLTVPHFAGVLDFSTLNQGAGITIDAVIYPWVGQAFTLSTDADPYPSPNLTTLRVLNDRTGAFGTAYAYVDAMLGTSGGVASAVPATAAASPFQTVAQAAAAIRAFNNANYGRNFTDGGVIRLVEGTHTLSAAIRTTGVTALWPLILEAADPAKRASTIFTDRGTTLGSSIPNQMVIRNLTLARSVTGNIQFLDQASANLTYGTYLAFENCRFVSNGFTAYAAWVYRCSRIWLEGCSGDITDTVAAITPSSQNKTMFCLGSTAIPGNTAYGALGSTGLGDNVAITAGTAARAEPVGSFYGWNAMRSNSGSNAAFRNQIAIGPRGLAVVGNTIEVFGVSTSPALWINGDGNVSPVQNVVVQCNTATGERANLLYLDAATEVIKSGYFRFNAFESFNIKGDYHSKVGVVGNWPMRFKTGWLANSSRFGSADGNAYGSQSWLGEFASAGEVSGTSAAWLPMNFADDRSNAAGGTGTGGGDYTPGPGHQLPHIPAGLAPYPVDQKGRAISNAGTAVIGALQRG